MAVDSNRLRFHVAGVLLCALCLLLTARSGRGEQASGAAQGTSTEASQPNAERLVAPDAREIEYSGYMRKEIVQLSSTPKASAARFDRISKMLATGYQWDNPGACIHFRTDASSVVALLYYNEKHHSKTARNSIGVYAVDGAMKPEWTFQSRQQSVIRESETASVTLHAGSAGFHTYELFLPYGDSVDFAGLQVNPAARFEPTTAKATVRYVAYGDSVTQGFTASAIDKTYPFLVGRKKGWETINFGLAGRSSVSEAEDAAVMAGLKADVITIMIGVNDWQGGVSLDRYRMNIERLLASIRAAQQKTPIYIMTALWVDPAWNPPKKIADLENYRQAVREVVHALKDPNLHLIEGPALIDHDKALFDKVSVHPNDAGFAQMADRIEKQLSDPRSMHTAR